MTYCQYINYYHDYCHCSLYPFDNGMYVPFVTKIKYRFEFDSTDVNIPSDPTRRYYIPKWNGKPTTEYTILNWNTVKMHHLSWVRNDIRKKLDSWSSKKLFTDYDKHIERAINDYNRFDMQKEYQDVCILFNTPNQMVSVRKLDKPYIHPVRDISYYSSSANFMKNINKT